MCCQSRKTLPCFRVWYSINSVFMKNPLSLFDQVSSEECSSGIDPSQTYVSSQTILKDENPLPLFDSSQWFSTHYPLPCLFLDVFRAESDFMSLSLLARVPSWVCSTLNLKLYKKCYILEFTSKNSCSSLGGLEISLFISKSLAFSLTCSCTS